MLYVVVGVPLLIWGIVHFVPKGVAGFFDPARKVKAAVAGSSKTNDVAVSRVRSKDPSETREGVTVSTQTAVDGQFIGRQLKNMLKKRGGQALGQLFFSQFRMNP